MLSNRPPKSPKTSKDLEVGTQEDQGFASARVQNAQWVVTWQLLMKKRTKDSTSTKKVGNLEFGCESWNAAIANHSDHIPKPLEVSLAIFNTLYELFHTSRALLPVIRPPNFNLERMVL